MSPNRGISSAKVASVAAIVSVLTACGTINAPSPVATPLDRVVKVDRLNPPTGVITYITERGDPAYGPSVRDAKELETADDVRKLKGAPDDFKAFIVQQMAERAAFVQAQMAEKHTDLVTEECDFTVQFRVWGIASDVATGRVRGCDLDSYDVIWQKKDGAWRQASRQQGGWDCSELNHYRVPAAITAAVCWYDGGRKTRAYDGPTGT